VSSDHELAPAVSDRLAYLFKRVQLDLAGLHDQVLAPFGISAGELAVLLLIDAHEPGSQQQIARRLGIDRTSMVELVDDLEAKQLVARRPDTTDRRRKLVELTAKGRTTLRRATSASDQAEQQLLAGLDEDEADQLRSLLRRIAAAPPHGRPR